MLLRDAIDKPLGDPGAEEGGRDEQQHAPGQPRREPRAFVEIGDQAGGVDSQGDGADGGQVDGLGQVERRQEHGADRAAHPEDSGKESRQRTAHGTRGSAGGNLKGTAHQQKRPENAGQDGAGDAEDQRGTDDRGDNPRASRS